MVTQLSLEGEKVTIVLRHWDGKEKRQLNKGAFFQVHIYNTICCFRNYFF